MPENRYVRGEQWKRLLWRCKVNIESQMQTGNPHHYQAMLVQSLET